MNWKTSREYNLKKKTGNTVKTNISSVIHARYFQRSSTSIRWPKFEKKRVMFGHSLNITKADRFCILFQLDKSAFLGFGEMEDFGS
jgi:hypothetical protein